MLSSHFPICCHFPCESFITPPIHFHNFHFLCLPEVTLLHTSGIFHILGNILFRKKKYSDALDVYMSALKVLPYDSKTLLNIAQVHLINWCHAMLFVKNPILDMSSKLQKHMHLKIDFIYFIFLNSSYLESSRAHIDYAIDRCFEVFCDVLNVSFSF